LAELRVVLERDFYRRAGQDERQAAARRTPEVHQFTFGLTLEKRLDEPVLLIKTA
jgi:hypothetical protein